jgi:hypothetical protein
VRVWQEVIWDDGKETEGTAVCGFDGIFFGAGLFLIYREYSLFFGLFCSYVL